MVLCKNIKHKIDGFLLMGPTATRNPSSEVIFIIPFFTVFMEGKSTN